MARVDLEPLYAALRRWPDVEAPNLFAVDAADRLLVDTCDEFLASADAGWRRTVAVIGDHYGALSLAALALGASRVQVYTDALTARRAIEANLKRCAPLLPSDAADRLVFSPLSLAAQGAEVGLMALPRGLNVLLEQASAVAAAGGDDFVLFAAGRVKHMNRSMNQVLEQHFARVQASLARQKSRVLTAQTPRADRAELPYPVVQEHRVGGQVFTLRAGAQTFGEARLDPGTRVMLENLPDLSDHRRLVDLACGNGSIGIFAALRTPNLLVDASDHSASAVASTLAGAQANGLSGRITAVQDDGLSRLPDASQTLVTLNPPFHIGNTVTEAIALKLIDEAARVLAEGGELICVFNSHLRYRSELSRRIGPTQQLARTPKFTLTRSIRRR